MELKTVPVDPTAPVPPPTAQELLNEGFADLPAPFTVLHGALGSLTVPDVRGHRTVTSPQPNLFHLLDRLGIGARTTQEPAPVVPRHHGRYGAPLPTGAGHASGRYEHRALRAYLKMVHGDGGVIPDRPSLWGHASRWLARMEHWPLAALLDQRLALAQDFTTHDSSVAPPDALTSDSVPVCPPALPVLRGAVPWALPPDDAPAQEPPWSTWTHRWVVAYLEADRLGSCDGPMGPALTPEDRLAIERFARTVHTVWAFTCACPQAGAANVRFHRHPLARAVEVSLAPEPRTSPRPSIASAPLLHHLARNPDWAQHPQDGLALLRALIGLGVSPAGQGLTTALHEAVRLGRAPLVHALLDAGASINLPNGNGVRPVHLALSRDQPETARALLARGAQHAPFEETTSPDSPLVLRHLVRLMTDPREDPNRRLEDPVVFRFGLPPFNLVSGSTVLHWAVQQRLPRLIGYLVQRGADPAVTDANGFSAWALADAGTKGRLNDEVVTALRDAFAAVERVVLDETLRDEPSLPPAVPRGARARL